MEKWKCTVCGYIHEGPMTPDFKCPICKQPANKFVKIEDAAAPARIPMQAPKPRKICGKPLLVNLRHATNILTLLQ